MLNRHICCYLIKFLTDELNEVKVNTKLVSENKKTRKQKSVAVFNWKQLFSEN